MDLGPPDYVNSAALQRECLHSRRSSPTHGPLRARLQKLNSAHNVWDRSRPDPSMRAAARSTGLVTIRVLSMRGCTTRRVR